MLHTNSTRFRSVLILLIFITGLLISSHAQAQWEQTGSGSTYPCGTIEWVYHKGKNWYLGVSDNCLAIWDGNNLSVTQLTTGVGYMNSFSLVYAHSNDPAKQRIYLFGGNDTISWKDYYNDIWEMKISASDEITWSKIEVTTGDKPSARKYSAFAYNPTNDQLVLFGGVNGDAGDNELCDTWVFDIANKQWTQKATVPSQTPSGDGLYHREMVFNPATGNILYVDREPRSNPKIWKWNGSSWSIHSTVNDDAMRYSIFFCYKWNKIVLVSKQGHVWQLNGSVFDKIYDLEHSMGSQIKEGPIYPITYCSHNRIYSFKNSPPEITPELTPKRLSGTQQIFATVTDTEGEPNPSLPAVKIRYRIGTSGGYTTASMHKEAEPNRYGFDLTVKNDTLEYDIEAVDRWGEIKEVGPYTVTVKDAAEIKVDITPADLGATWRWISPNGSSTWLTTKTTQNVYPEGITVEFSDVGVNYDTPASVGISTSGPHTINATYTRHTGSLKVDLQYDPSDAGETGGRWRRQDTSTWYTSGHTETDIPTGSYTIEFIDVNDWDKPAMLIIPVNKNETASKTATYVKHRGNIQVDIDYTGSGSITGQWQLAGYDGASEWFNSGAVRSLPVGNYTISFKEVDDWDKPADQAITVIKDQNESYSGTYVQHTGTVTVTLSPQEAIDSGAQWKITNTAGYDSGWQNSGSTLIDIPVGNYTISFNGIDYWNSPADQPLALAKDQDFQGNGVYVRQKGSLKVTLNPADVRPNARWSIDGNQWYSSGYTLADIDCGPVTVLFNKVTDWYSPVPQDCIITENNTQTVEATYTVHAGSLQVFIEPASANNLDASWSIDGTNWYDSGQVVDDIAVGTVIVKFSQVANWTSPENIPVTIRENSLSTTTGVYQEHRGAIKVNILPEAASREGAKWSLNGKNWRPGGSTASNLKVGSYTIHYLAIDGWSVPENRTVVVKNNITSEITGTYSQQTGSLKVNILPAEANNEGAAWSLDGENWFGSGYTANEVIIGKQKVFFKNVDNWKTPAQLEVQIVAGKTTTAQGSYQRSTGSLQFNLTPAAVNNQKAKWGIESAPGSVQWFNSGAKANNLPAGNYKIVFSDLIGYLEPEARTVSVKTGPTQTANAQYSDKCASLSGRVVDESGNPLWSVNILVTKGDQSWSKYLNPGDNGKFTIHDIPLGSGIKVKAEKQNFTFKPAEYSLNLTKRGHYSLSNFVGKYDPADKSIRGRVTIENKGVAGVELHLNGGHSVTSNDLGHYQFTGLTSGDYTVSIKPTVNRESKPWYRKATVKKEDVDNIDFTIVPLNLEISGRVLHENNSGYAGIRIMLKGKESQYQVSGSDGSFSFRSLKPGNYTLSVLTKPETFVSSSMKLSLSDSEITGLTFLEKPKVINSVTMGDLTIFADEITKAGFGTFNTKGTAILGEHQMLRTDSNLFIDINNRLISGNGKISSPPVPIIGNLDFFEGPFNINNKRLDLTSYDPFSFDFASYHFGVNGLELSNKFFNLDCDMTLPAIFGDVDATAKVGIYANGPKLRDFTVSFDRIPLAKKWVVKDGFFSYTSKDERFFGSGTLDAKTFDVDASLEFLKGQLNAVTFQVYKIIPVHAPVLYLTTIGGGIQNLNTDEPIYIHANAKLAIRKSGIKYNLAYANLHKLIVWLSGSFKGWGNLEILGLEAGTGNFGYDAETKHAHLQVAFGLNKTVKFSASGIVNVLFSPFSFSGAMNASLKVPVKFGVDPISYTQDVSVGSCGAEFTEDHLEVWGRIMGATLKAKLTKDKFQISSPGWLDWIKVNFSEGGKKADRLAVKSIPASDKREFYLSENLAKAHFLIMWQQGQAHPKLISPEGKQLSEKRLQEDGIIERYGDRALSITLLSPVAGKWKVKIPNESNLGTTTVQLTEYPYAPGVVISSVEESGQGQTTIKLIRSREENRVKLFYGKDNDDQLNTICDSEQLGQADSWVWDTCKVKPGKYYIFAKVYSDTSFPFTYRYPQAVKVVDDASVQEEQLLKIKRVKKGLKISWPSFYDDNLISLRLYYGSSSNEEFTDYCDVDPSKSKVILSSELLKPGQDYRFALAQIHEIHGEGNLSKPVEFTFKLKNANNEPHFVSTPRKAVRLGRNFNYKPKVVEMDNEKLFFNLRKGPEGMKVDYQTGKLSWNTSHLETGGSYQVKLVVADENGAEDSQMFYVEVKNPDEKGILELRPVTDSRGKKGYLVSYWNPNMNEDERASETLGAKVGNSVSGNLPIVLRESGNNTGFFSAYVTPQMLSGIKQSIKANASSGNYAMDSDLQVVLNNRKEKVAVRIK